MGGSKEDTAGPRYIVVSTVVGSLQVARAMVNTRWKRCKRIDSSLRLNTLSRVVGLREEPSQSWKLTCVLHAQEEEEKMVGFWAWRVGPDAGLRDATNTVSLSSKKTPKTTTAGATTAAWGNATIPGSVSRNASMSAKPVGVALASHIGA